MPIWTVNHAYGSVLALHFSARTARFALVVAWFGCEFGYLAKRALRDDRFLQGRIPTLYRVMLRLIMSSAAWATGLGGRTAAAYLPQILDYAGGRISHRLPPCSTGAKASGLDGVFNVP